MEMKQIHSGRLRAAGYDCRTRTLRVEFDDGTVLDHAGVGEEAWRRLAASASAWSYYRDNIEEEFTARRASAASTRSSENPLDALFRKD
ncbi:MAG: KTSC domain-containing protein [Rhodocyclaceae bacterium]|nr:KTSC domain-containing protein [Rhodocyclaceae bacterium]